jgi:type IV secretory pathway TraG/TraD family ATPase VirD4
VLGVQDLSQLDELYGHNITRSIAGLTGTKVIFRAADEYNAERFSRFLGKQEVIESNESITFGAHQVRDGISLSEHRQTKPVVSLNDIMALNNLEAYLSLPGNVPVAKLGFQYHELPGLAVNFIQKIEDLRLLEHEVTCG